MTSQIVLINQSGIGIASDTLTSRHESSGGHKTFPSANKIYDLGANHKVVVLHSGTTAIGDLQYELLVREWSLQQPSPLPSLADYPRVFEDWLSDYRKLEINEGRVVYGLLCHAFGRFCDGLNDELKSSLTQISYADDELTIEVQNELASRLVSHADRYFVDDQPFTDLTPDAIKRMLGSQESDLFEHFQEHVALTVNEEKVSWRGSQALIDAVNDFAVKRLLHWCWSPNTAELNFVGFGSDEPIGGIVKVRVAGFYSGRLRVSREDRMPKSGSSDSAISTIAQDEAMGDFIRGISVERQEVLVNLATEVFSEVTSGLGMNEEVPKKFWETFDRNLDRHLWNEFTEPFRRTLSGLSLHSLVLFSEALVKIQSLRSATAPGEATVGGLIESLSVHREAGVVWHFRASEHAKMGEHSPHPFM